MPSSLFLWDVLNEGSLINDLLTVTLAHSLISQWQRNVNSFPVGNCPYPLKQEHHYCLGIVIMIRLTCRVQVYVCGSLFWNISYNMWLPGSPSKLSPGGSIANSGRHSLSLQAQRIYSSWNGLMGTFSSDSELLTSHGHWIRPFHWERREDGTNSCWLAVGRAKAK